MDLEEQILDGDQAGFDPHLPSRMSLEIFSYGRP
jgi:hypothetical protein